MSQESFENEVRKLLKRFEGYRGEEHGKFSESLRAMIISDFRSDKLLTEDERAGAEKVLLWINCFLEFELYPTPQAPKAT